MSACRCVNGKALVWEVLRNFSPVACCGSKLNVLHYAHNTVYNSDNDANGTCCMHISITAIITQSPNWRDWCVCACTMLHLWTSRLQQGWHLADSAAAADSMLHCPHQDSGQRQQASLNWPWLWWSLGGAPHLLEVGALSRGDPHPPT